MMYKVEWFDFGQCPGICAPESDFTSVEILQGINLVAGAGALPLTGWDQVTQGHWTSKAESGWVLFVFWPDYQILHDRKFNINKWHILSIVKAYYSAKSILWVDWLHMYIVHAVALWTKLLLNDVWHIHHNNRICWVVEQGRTRP